MIEGEETAGATTGETLRSAREAQGLSIEDIASSTRIPKRHLESLENGEWDKLPASTYTMGFAKSYAGAVGLDRAAVGEQLRQEMGGYRTPNAAAEVFEPADPARTMPRWLVFTALLAVLLVIGVMTWMQNRSIEGPDAANPAMPDASQPGGTAASPASAPAVVPAATGPVVVTANEPVWIQVKDGPAKLYEAELNAGQSYEVPATAKAPTLTTGRPESLRISVGTADAPAVGPAGKTVSGVSLRAADLLRGPAVTSPPAVAAGNAAAPAE